MPAHPSVDPATSPAPIERAGQPASLRLPATLLLAGQLLYIAVTLLHTGGNANDHHDVFTDYADSGSWTVVHLGQFAGMALFLAGLLALSSALTGPPRVTARVGAATATAALALYGALQAVDGVALKHAVTAWASAPDAEKAARFAAAEAIRWLEWGLRSYQNVTLGLALLLLSAAVARAARIPRPVAPLMALAGLTYLVQGWVVGSEGFSHTESLAIVVAHALNLAWMTWLAVAARRTPAPGAPTPGR
jgi:hypothetical protein